MKVLLSIKPEFANKIFDGTKKFEFRRSVFKNKNIKKIIVYASAPISRVIGEFDIDIVIKKNIHELWNDTEEFSGITKEFYLSYFEGKEEGFAIKVKEVRKYKENFSIEERYGKKAPQSFLYIA